MTLNVNQIYIFHKWLSNNINGQDIQPFSYFFRYIIHYPVGRISGLFVIRSIPNHTNPKGDEAQFVGVLQLTHCYLKLTHQVTAQI